MSEKHFVLVCDTNLEWLMQDELLLPIVQKDNNKQISLRQCYILLNELAEENKQLKQENAKFARFIRRNHAVGMIHRILTGDVK